MQAVASGSGSAVGMTDSMTQTLMERVETYEDHHTLRCLALAGRLRLRSNKLVLAYLLCSLHLMALLCGAGGGE